MSNIEELRQNNVNGSTLKVVLDLKGTDLLVLNDWLSLLIIFLFFLLIFSNFIVLDLDNFIFEFIDNILGSDKIDLIIL